uniref:Uncharacterized protein n=1 Tax=Chromera velia CCMP2878 TaxID=1169474 RepID=A0A0G4IEB7_9ALVE|eukprot:Cvel_2379.t1-p1 / transcript=Cvel_2379.t1 / gene=Cvel_2379 / organism=Chromera_velia_CCMP2878 / gene_product=hypothetical protein / transcript_product=hypothetical protein / location=Cvel_scaffold92:64878-65807(-) / protein_length=310 / sequence_SO=supercontig / SO=protein_coding / is_pseudo=false
MTERPARDTEGHKFILWKDAAFKTTSSVPTASERGTFGQPAGPSEETQPTGQHQTENKDHTEFGTRKGPTKWTFWQPGSHMTNLRTGWVLDPLDQPGDPCQAHNSSHRHPYTAPVVFSLSAALSAAIVVAQPVTPSEVPDESDPAFYPLSSPVHLNDSVPPPSQPHQQQQQQQQQQNAATPMLTAQVGGIAALLPSALGTSPMFFTDSSPQPYQQTGLLSPFRQLSPIPTPTAEPPAGYLTGYPFDQPEPKYWIQSLRDFILPINVLGMRNFSSSSHQTGGSPPLSPRCPLAGEGKLFCRICTKERRGWE